MATKYNQAKYKVNRAWLNGVEIPFVITASAEQGWIHSYRTKDGEKTTTRIVRNGVVTVE